MSEWWSYSLSDFQMYSAGTWWRLLEAYNAWLWPWQLPVLAFGGWLVWAAWQGGWRALRHALIALGLCWLGVAVAFFQRHLTPIDLAAPYFVYAFALQGLLLCVWASLRVEQPLPPPERRLHGALFVDVSVTVLPFVAPLFHLATGQEAHWRGVMLFGVTPDATALATLGVLAAVRAPLWLFAVPLAWCLLSAGLLWNLGEHWSPALVLLAVAACGLRAFPGLRRGPRTGL